MPNENDNKLVTLADLAEAYSALYNRDVTTTATQSANGLMSSSDKIKLDGIAPGAQVNSVTSVNNQTGAVSITPANIGAVAKSGDTMTGALTAPHMAAKSDDWRFYLMQDANGSDIANMRSDQQTHHIILREMTPGTNGAYEDYSLPIPTIQSSGIGYNILTTKSPVLVTQGGTGATTAEGARANLEITPANIGAVSKAGGDIINGPLSLKNTDATTRYELVAWPNNDFAITCVGSIYPEGWSRIVYIQSDGTISLIAPLPVPSGGTGATTAAVTITNEYSSVLNAINAVKGTRIFPISIQKNQNSSYSDMPSGTETYEWNLLLIGDKTRLSAMLYIFNDANNHIYVRQFLIDHWLYDWVQIN